VRRAADRGRPDGYGSAVTAAEFFAQLPSRFDPAAAAGVSAVIQFELSGDGGGTWHVVIADGRCAVAEGPHSDPTLVVMASADTWLKVVDGKLDPQFAFMTGRLKVRGDMGLALRLRSLFL
jgi:putative sterol carrier protein